MPFSIGFTFCEIEFKGYYVSGQKMGKNFLNWAEKNWTPCLENNSILMEAHIIYIFGYSAVTRTPSEICWVVLTKGEVMWAIIVQKVKFVHPLSSISILVTVENSFITWFISSHFLLISVCSFFSFLFHHYCTRTFLSGKSFINFTLYDQLKSPILNGIQGTRTSLTKGQIISE